MKTAFLLATALLLLSPVLITPTLDASHFEGPYVGLHTGYLQGKHSDVQRNSHEPIWFVDNVKPKGMVWGLFAGFNKVVSNVLYGIEADIDHLRARGGKNSHAPGQPDNGYPMKNQHRCAASLRARLGLIFNHDSTLVFITGGQAIARLRTDLYNLTGDVLYDSDIRNIYGWTAGLGLEQSITEKLSMKLEYRHSLYRSFRLYDTQYSGVSPGSDRISSKSDSIRLGFSYHF